MRFSRCHTSRTDDLQTGDHDMKTIHALKLAVSTLVIGASFVATGANSASQNGASTASQSQMERAAANDAAKAQKAFAAHKFDKAIGFAERAVASMPSDAGYRMLLGESYLSSGRFNSAETAFSDTLSLNGSNERAALKLALTQIALGKRAEAMAVLEDHRSALSAADYGLAVALAGDPDAGVRALEPAARAMDANAKTRQNLALTYALAGRWMDARAVAAQDLPANMVDKRIVEWASFTRPLTAADQVASLLGVTPVFDGGQPAALALVQRADQQVAAVEPVAVAPAEPAMVAQVEPVPAAIAAEPAFEVAVAAPVAAPEAIAKAMRAESPAPMIRANPAPIKQVVVAVAPTKSGRVKTSESGRFVVQLGAFSSASRADAAWAGATRKMANLSSYDAAQSRVKVRTASLYRLSVSGFTSREDAGRVCTQIKSSGGTCFVRSFAGDQTWRMAARKGQGTRLAARR
jgi:Flp pilus assembly protein TadD